LFKIVSYTNPARWSCLPRSSIVRLFIFHFILDVRQSRRNNSLSGADSRQAAPISLINRPAVWLYYAPQRSPYIYTSILS